MARCRYITKWDAVHNITQLEAARRRSRNSERRIRRIFEKKQREFDRPLQLWPSYYFDSRSESWAPSKWYRLPTIVKPSEDL